MEQVSDAYKESMESVLRERGYIMVTFGLTVEEAKALAPASLEPLEVLSADDSDYVLSIDGNGTVLALNDGNVVETDKGAVYFNDDVIDSSLESYISPISEDIPQIDFSVKLKNYDQYFNVENPDSDFNLYESGQEVNVMYGYDTPGTDSIEWIQGAHLLCSDWESDETSVTIRAQDVMRTLTGEYYQGTRYAYEVSYLVLANQIAKAAGITDYDFDACLNDQHTSHPMPRVTYAVALQMIANACCCELSISRSGTIQIKRVNRVPLCILYGEPAAYFSGLFYEDTTKAEYADLSQNYTRVDGTVYFAPRTVPTGDDKLSVGYISSNISDANCEFSTNPKIIFSYTEGSQTFGALHIRFGSVLPAAFTITSYLNDTIVKTYNVESSEISQDYFGFYDFGTFTEVIVEFTKTAQPYNRIIVYYANMSNLVDFTMTKNDMLSYAKAKKQALLKQVIVPYTKLYEDSSAEYETILSESIEVTANDTSTYYFNESYDTLKVSLDGDSSNVSITECGAYYVVVKFAVGGTHTLVISGKRTGEIEERATHIPNDTGEVITWSNPLLSNYDDASKVAEWLSDYYTEKFEYEYDTRGNPELNVGDVIRQANNYQSSVIVAVTSHTINFKQSFSGKITTRRTKG